MVCSCGWGHPRPRLLPSEEFVERSVQLWLGAPQTPLFLPGPGAEPQRKLLALRSTHYRSRRRDCFTSDLERFDVMPRRLTDYPSLLRVRRDVIIEFCFNIIPTTGGSAFGSGPRASQTKTRATGQDFAELITPHGFERGGWRANAENETRQNITTGVRFPFVKSHPECGIQSEFRVQNCPAKTYALQKSSLQRLLGSRHLK